MAIELEANTPKESELRTNIKEDKGKLIFDKPSRNMTQHLKPLYINVHMEDRPMNRVLIYNGATVNLCPLSMMRKLSKVDSDLVPTNVSVYGFLGNATRTKGIIQLELRVGSRTQVTTFFVVDTSSNYNALLGRD